MSSPINARGRHINFIILLLVGGLLGWAANMFLGTNERPSITLNVIVGIVGVVLGAWLLSGLVGSSPFDQVEFSLVGLLVSLLGAAVLLAAMELLRGTTELQGRAAPKRDLIMYARYSLQKPVNKVREQPK